MSFPVFAQEMRNLVLMRSRSMFDAGTSLARQQFENALEKNIKQTLKKKEGSRRNSIQRTFSFDKETLVEAIAEETEEKEDKEEAHGRIEEVEKKLNSLEDKMDRLLDALSSK